VVNAPSRLPPRDRPGTSTSNQDTTACCHVTSNALRTNQFYYSELLTASLHTCRVTEHKSVFIFSIQHLSETFLLLSRIERDVIKNVFWSLCTVIIVY